MILYYYVSPPRLRCKMKSGDPSPRMTDCACGGGGGERSAGGAHHRRNCSLLLLLLPSFLPSLLPPSLSPPPHSLPLHPSNHHLRWSNIFPPLPRPLRALGLPSSPPSLSLPSVRLTPLPKRLGRQISQVQSSSSPSSSFLRRMLDMLCCLSSFQRGGGGRRKEGGGERGERERKSRGRVVIMVFGMARCQLGHYRSSFPFLGKGEGTTATTTTRRLSFSSPFQSRPLFLLFQRGYFAARSSSSFDLFFPSLALGFKSEGGRR